MDSELDLGTVSRVMPKLTCMPVLEDRVSNFDSSNLTVTIDRAILLYA
jgi:hypothetical protein